MRSTRTAQRVRLPPTPADPAPVRVTRVLPSRRAEYKAACIMNCCRVISTILTIMSKDGSGVGADEFLPALIYTVIHANPDRLFSNLK